MAEELIQKSEIVGLGSVESEEDFKPRPAININPPPRELRCECCERQISELKPFGSDGESVPRKLNGAYLVRSFRPYIPYDEEADSVMKEALQRYVDAGFKSAFEWMVDTYGEARAKDLSMTAQLASTLSNVWQCRDCAILDDEQYFKKIYASRRAKK